MTSSNAALLSRAIAAFSSSFVPGVDLGFDLRAGWPAEPRLLAVGADCGIGRGIDTNRAGVPRMEHLPAALAGRRFLRPARGVCTPIDGGKIDIHAKPSQQVSGDFALGFGDWQILCHHTGDRLAGIATLSQQSFGGIEVTRTFENLTALLAVERRARREEAGQRLP